MWKKFLRLCEHLLGLVYLKLHRIVNFKVIIKLIVTLEAEMVLLCDATKIFRNIFRDSAKKTIFLQKSEKFTFLVISPKLCMVET